jgi:hypothetical protein
MPLDFLDLVWPVGQEPDAERALIDCNVSSRKALIATGTVALQSCAPDEN